MARKSKQPALGTRLAIVVWLDAIEHSDGATLPRHSPSVQVLVGWFLKRDKRGISVASEYSSDDNTWRGENFIPAGMISSVTYVELDKDDNPCLA